MCVVLRATVFRATAFGNSRVFSGKAFLGWFSMCWLSWFSGPGCCSCPGFNLWLMLPAAPLPPVQKRDAQHKFLQHAPKFGARWIWSFPRVVHLDGQNRQSPIASVQRTRSALANHSAVPRGTNVKRMNANRAIRIAAQRGQGLWGLISVFRAET